VFRNDYSEIYKAESIIERDAIAAFLKGHGIAFLVPARDLSRKITDTTVDISFEGYSAMFDGFAILVQNNDVPRARELIKNFSANLAKSEVSQDYMRRFYLSSMATLIMPVVFHFTAFYNLWMGLKRRQSISMTKMIFSIFCLIATGYMGYFLVSATASFFSNLLSIFSAV
jgi:membrane protein insertase Oxa1/YidC/SpoIIIJ